jgi:hypothetical protein
VTDNADEAAATVRLEGRLRTWFTKEVDRADRDLVAAPLSVPAPRTRRTRISGAGLTVLVGIGIVALLRNAPASMPGGNGSSPVPSPTVGSARVTAWYSDGIPAAIDGEKVYRPKDIVPGAPSGSFLVGGWDFGPLYASCPVSIYGASPPSCPLYEGLEENKGGVKVLNVMLDQPYVSGAQIVVVRAEVIPLPDCTSTPAGGCPEKPSVHASAVLWQGSAGP